SERTKIRASVIRSIESDDYEACGGDLYVRGYVRAIAGAIGVDAQGLIRDYDQARVHASGDADATMFDLPAVAASDAGSGAATGRQDPDETRFDLPAVRDDRDDFAATRFDIPAVRADPAEDLMAAGYDVQPAAGGAGAGPGTPAGSARPQAAAAGPGSPTGRRRRRLLAGVAAVAVLVVAGVLGVRLASGSTTTKNTADSTTAQASASAKAAADSKPAANPTTTPSATATPSVTTKPTPTENPHVSPPVTRLSLSAAEAFGPGGPGDGDNPSGASRVLASDSPLPWSTNWYTTAKFGMLKSGTGLLLTLDHQSTITSVRLDLTGYRGVNLQLKVGDGSSPQDFKVVATADNTGGTVRLTLRHPASTRYLLVWFTQLPPNGDGQYQESVYHVKVNGHR
ncbi:MAG TPA: helix-turn-helix transcriptional regulator, partial [Trebonia sp.]|nr:helix-turn-helix transcriptional regulator [Trebonia sp.]